MPEQGLRQAVSRRNACGRARERPDRANEKANDDPVEGGVAERATAPVAPPAAEAEKELCKLSPVMFRRYPFRCAGYGILAVAGLVAVLTGLITGSMFWLIVGLAGAGFAAYRLLVWRLRVRSTTVTITSKRCVVESGLLSKNTTEVPRNALQDIQIVQTPFQSFFNVGDIVLVSKNGDTQRVVLMAVHDPKAVAGLLQEKV
ncbi:MAG: PH domain-containing protein [Gemmataceae bacterium]|nr:PH domain-containing protein [Gemmataceae bacterium]MCI0738990.1 PH domain-containing protein [Gemmataceae bacterium]